MDNPEPIIMFANMMMRLNENILTICKLEEESEKELMEFMMRRDRVPRSVWAIERHGTFWSKDIKEGSAELFKQSFRMDRATFDMLVKQMQGIGKTSTNFRRTIPVDERVAIALYTLGSSAEYRTVGTLFGVSKALVCSILQEFCLEVIKKLAPKYLSPDFITQAKIEECVKGFESLGFPQCYGAIDGCHIEVKPPAEEAADYFNCKGWYSMVLFALVDYRFHYVQVGAPGRCTDLQIYNQSRLRTALDSSDLLEKNDKMLCGTNVPVLLIGDSAFRFSKRLMIPYPFTPDATEEQRLFNNSLLKSRRVVENAFGHLKARFQRLGKGLDNKLENCRNIIICCCILHNFLNNMNSSINANWKSNVNNRPQPEETNELSDLNTPAEDIRAAISRHLQENVQ